MGIQWLKVLLSGVTHKASGQASRKEEPQYKLSPTVSTFIHSRVGIPPVRSLSHARQIASISVW